MQPTRTTQPTRTMTRPATPMTEAARRLRPATSIPTVKSITRGLNNRYIPRRLEPLTRKGSVIVKLRCPPDLKQPLKMVAELKGLSVNRLIRKAIRSRRYYPIPEPTEAAKALLHLRLTPDEYQSLKDYAAAWGVPLWRALWLLVAHPYTVADRPRSMPYTPKTQSASYASPSWSFSAKAANSDALHAPYTYKERKERKEKRKEEDFMNECPSGAELKPANELAERLTSYGVTVRVANDLTMRYAREYIDAAIELTKRKNGAIYNPAGFIVHTLANGYAQKYAEAKAKAEAEALEAPALAVKEAVEKSLGIPVKIERTETKDGVPVAVPVAILEGETVTIPSYFTPERAVKILCKILNRPEPFPCFLSDDLTDPEPYREPAFSGELNEPELAEPVLSDGFTDPEPTEARADGFPEPFPSDGSTDPEPYRADEPEPPDELRCQKCGRHDGEIPVSEISGLCVECEGKPRRCADCGMDDKDPVRAQEIGGLVYSDRFEELLCRRCLLVRLAALAGLKDYKPPERFPRVEVEDRKPPAPDIEVERGDEGCLPA